jgi:Uma2 family endonuclease
MSSLIAIPEVETDLPDHMQLPEKDDVPVMNSLEQFQNALLSDSLEPVLQQLHPDRHYFIGQDTGIYWRPTKPPMAGCKSPDWYYVPGAVPLPSGEYRRSYVLWYENLLPLVALEHASGDGSEEHDRTPYKGKFWVYEQGIHIPYYGIHLFGTGQVEMYHLNDVRYKAMSPNENGRFVIPPMGVELGVWHGVFAGVETNWLRWWDLQGNMLLTGSERAAKEAERAAKEAEQAAKEKERAAKEAAHAERLAAKLRELGVDPNSIK